LNKSNIDSVRNIESVLEQLNQTEYGSHYIIVYPNLANLRELYSRYIKTEIEENDMIVLILPFYETTDSVRRILSEGTSINVTKYEKHHSLMIVDSARAYFGSSSSADLVSFIKSLAKYAKQVGRNGICALCDIGSFYHSRLKVDGLIAHEASLPSKFDMNIKAFCLYHIADYDNRYVNKNKCYLNIMAEK
jgi:MEDS: MEthanogen/methylotroph, DcmR Sensory domain